MNIILIFKNSAKELKSVRCLTTTGFLCALYIVLTAYVPQTEVLRISFGYLALAIIGMLFGPVVAVLAAVPCDIIVGIISPFPFNPLFIPSRMLEGLIYGIFLYGYGSRGTDNSKSGAVWAAWQVMRIVISRFLVAVFCYFILNSFAIFVLSLPPGRAQEILATQSFWVWAFARTGIKTIAQFPVDFALMFTLLPAVNIAYIKTLQSFGKERKS